MVGRHTAQYDPPHDRAAAAHDVTLVEDGLRGIFAGTPARFNPGHL
jgi:hypothetical protein